MADMAFGTRAELLDAVKRELDRDDLDAEIPGFLVLGESDINADTQPQSSVLHATLTCNADYKNLPTDFQTPYALTVTNQSNIASMRYVTPDRLADLRAMNLSGCPLHYSIVGTQLWFDRTPTNVIIDLAYFSGIAALVADGDTNTLLVGFPPLYFYAVLLHSAPFLKDDPRIALWSKLYQDNVARVVLQMERARRGPGPLVVKPRRGFC